MSNTEMFSSDRTPANHGGGHFRTMAQLNWWQAIAAGTAVAVIVNLVIFFIGAAVGASFAVLKGGTLTETTAWGVIIATVPPLVVGTLLATLLARRWFWMIRVAQVIGGALALLTMAGPLMADTDDTTRATLALMHVALAVIVVVTLEAIRRRARASHQV